MKTSNVSVKHLLSFISDEQLENMALMSGVDYNVKKWEGKKLFKLLLYSLVQSTRLSLNVISEKSGTALYKRYAGLPPEAEKISRSSLADRLSTVPVGYFEGLYAYSRAMFEKHYQLSEQPHSHQCYYDSTSVSCSGKLLSFGMYNGIKPKDDKERVKQLKFSIGFDGLLTQQVDMYSSQTYLAEDKALAETITKAKVKEADVVVFDRGLKKRKAFRAFSTESRWFVTRINPNSAYEVVMNCSNKQGRQTETLVLDTDQIVYLYSNGSLLKTPFRLIKARNLATNEEMYFLTNILDLSAEDVTNIYKKRWEIEKFFRFLKQELNFSHLVNRSENGIMVMLYMTLITAMMLLIYKKFNQKEGYKIMKLQFAEELLMDIIKDLVVQCGGSAEIFEKTYNSA